MPGSGPACLVCRAKSDQVVPRRPNLLTHFPDFSGSRPDPPGHDLARHFGSHFGSPQAPIDVRHPSTSKPPTAFPLAGGPSSVSTQSAPEGIRTPNLLIRSQMLYPLSYGRNERADYRSPRRPEKSSSDALEASGGSRRRVGTGIRTQPPERRFVPHFRA